MGDGFLATFDASGRAIRCAAEIVAGAQNIGLDLRVGIHTGEVEVRGDDIAGLAVTIAKRVCDLARPGEVLVTKTVTDHVVGSGIEFDDQGERELKGVPALGGYSRSSVEPDLQPHVDTGRLKPRDAPEGVPIRQSGLGPQLERRLVLPESF